MTRRSFPPVEQQLDRLRRGVVDFISEDELRSKLSRSRDEGAPLIVKVGFDPTAPDIHLGHTVLMRKMREFQDLGHHLVYVIGDLTASIGDPSGRVKTRPPLSREDIEKNAATYTDQAFKFLDAECTETRFNSEWLSSLGTSGTIKLAAQYTVARMLERRDFRERLELGSPVSVHELLYPLLQAYDSVALRADVELGGTDQLFNLNVGRDIMPYYDLEPQVLMTVPLLEGTDGTQKMSKSLDNSIGVTDPPREIFGKVMSISDELMQRWYALLIDDEDSSERRAAELAEGRAHPREMKAALAHQLVTRLHDGEAADRAREEFDAVFARRELPDDIPTVSLRAEEDVIWLPRLLKAAGMAKSTGEARRLVRQGGVRLDGERVTDDKGEIKTEGEVLIQVGKRRFVTVRFVA